MAGAADHRHVARAIAADATSFITRDDEILEASARLRQELRIDVVRPESLIVALDRLRSAGHYEPEALHATSVVELGPGDVDQKAFVSAFLNYGAGERTAELHSILRPALATPQQNDVRVFGPPRGNCWAP